MADSSQPVLVRAVWPDSLADGSIMGCRIRDFDWAATSLGPIAAWPQSLRSAVAMIVGNSFPMYIFWGAERVAIYNDSYVVIAGEKHPDLLGRPSAAARSEVWDVLEPLVRQVSETGRAVTLLDHFPIPRLGHGEEFYCTVAYSPLRDERDAIAGVLVTLTETTLSQLGQRRVETLRDIAACSAEALSEAETYAKIRAALEHRTDLPFALIYVHDGTGRDARLAASIGLREGAAAAPHTIDLADTSAPWQLADTIVSNESILVDDLAHRLPDLPGDPWPEPANAALIVPIVGGNKQAAFGAFVAGLSPRVKLDDTYREFIVLAAAQIANAIASARAYEAQRRRAAELIEIDRAKTAFFANVSHEFRTPLTLMLSPLDELLSKRDTLDDHIYTELSLVHRNALRLQKLVNALLEFSRLEAGRTQARYVACDLAELTIDLAAQFRPIVESAGLRYVVDIAPLEQAAYVDREMWETIVLNLISNAFKFTIEGAVEVTLELRGTFFECSVRDTGTGIAPAEQPRIFEWFHRDNAAQSRSHDGSGIGLALVRELAAVHGGTIRVDSAPGRGSTFTVCVPTGSAHLPLDQVEVESSRASSATRAQAYVGEAERWVAPAVDSRGPAAPWSAADGALPATQQPCIILADNNAGMREYVSRLLRSEYRIVAVSDGAAALAAVRTASPDLVLTDVMMPILDGFGLLRAIRADPALQAIPVIVLSARAGEESTVEGLQRGADDYIVKPFSARELLARVRANLELARLRRQYARELRIADAFQRASLPLTLPTIPGLQFDAVYAPGSSDARVGGDWYDALRLLDGRVVLSIGDVTGSGVAAAVTMGSVRQIIRGIAQVDADPVVMLNAADRALRLERPGLYVTAFVGILDPVTRTLAYACAGHPPPFLRWADGQTRSLAGAGLPLGLRQKDCEGASATIVLPEDALLVLYTDGLTESTRDPIEGECRLVAALRRDEIAFAPDPASRLLAAVLASSRTVDDVAILTVRVATASTTSEAGADPLVLQRWLFAHDDAAAAQTARREFGAALRSRGASFKDVYGAELIFGELVGNIVRYAPGAVEISVDWSGPAPVLHVLDQGPAYRLNAGLPNDPYSESGRGLFLVSTLTDDFRVTKRPERGSHACAVLTLERNRLAPTLDVHPAGPGEV